ncbi:MAG: FMN-binding negative transcriptional regulator [Rhizobiaceae bacterium]
MYQPPHFREERLDVLHALIRSHPLGLLISTSDDGPVADPLPFLVDPGDGPNGTLRAHLSKANPHWRAIEANPDMPVLVVFQGPQAYVTPSWYETKRQTGKVVPTWNYAIVQIRGNAEIVHDTDWLARQINNLTDTHEAARKDAWMVSDAPEKFVRAQIKGIVGLRIPIDHIEGKWKMSQNRPVEDRSGVADGYDIEGRGDLASIVRDRSAP